MSHTQFDWYKLSLINQQKPDVEKFEQIVRNGNISKGIERIPTTYRKNLLVMFQNISNKIKYQTKSTIAANDSLSYRKNVLADRNQQMQKGLQQSKNQLVIMKATLMQKKKMCKKLKQKIQTLKKNKGQQAYFCPFCSRNDFSSRQIFTFHMYSEHQTYKSEHENNLKVSMPNNSFSSTANNQLKDFIMTLKDKQMEMMKMILSQKKQLQTQQLQKLYQKQMHLMTMKNKSEPQYLSRQGLDTRNFQSQNNELQLGCDNDQLKGQSQFLFYQKSEQYKKAAQMQQYSLRKTIQQQRRRESNKHPYYDIFKDLQQNKSLQMEEQIFNNNQTNNKPTNRINYNDQLRQDDHFSNQSSGGGYKILQKFTLKSNEQLPQRKIELPSGVQPLKMTSTNLQYQQFNPSITDRLKEQQKKNNHNNSIYSNFGRKTVSKGFNDHQYVFNSGPLVDDNGSNSDYQDYFGQNILKNNKNLNQISRFKNQAQNSQSLAYSQNKINSPVNYNFDQANGSPDRNNNQHDQSIIEDEQIKLNPGSYSFVSKSTLSKQNISQFLSPNRQDYQNNSQLQQSELNNKYNKYHNIHQKSSQIVDLSDSFSKRDFSLSKDQQSINLSDLKLSKLQKKKAQDKQKYTSSFNKNQSNNIKSPTYLANQRKDQIQNHDRFSKKPKQYFLVSQQKQLNIHSTIQQPQITYLNQFEKKVQVTPNAPSNFSFQKKQAYQFDEFYKKSANQSYKLANNHTKQRSQMPRQLGGLNQFVRNTVARNQNISPNINEQTQQRAVSPQQFFVQQMKKVSSYGSSNQNNLKNIPQSNVSNTISEQQSSNQHLNRQYLSNNNRYYSNTQQTGNYINRNNSIEKSRSSSRQRKKFNRHQELESQNDGILNQFFKKQYAPPQKNNSQNNEEILNGLKRSSSYGSSNKTSNGKRQSSYNSSSEPNQSESIENGVLEEFIK